MLEESKRASIIQRADKIKGWMNESDLGWLADQASEHSIIIEVGSWKGRSTKALALATPGVVYAVDHWQGTENERGDKQSEANENDVYAVFEENLRPEIDSGRVVPVYSDCVAAIDTLRNLLGGKKADMVFIDGDHSYVAVRRDIGNYLGLLAKDGLMSGHDYSIYWPGVCRAVDEVFPHRELVKDGVIWFTRRRLP